MQLLTIGISDHIDEIKERLNSELELLEDKKVSVAVSDMNFSNLSTIICSVNDERIFGNKSKQLYDTLKIHVANILADYIIKQYEEKLITRIINSNYCYFNSMEKKDILAHAIKNIKNEDKNIINSLYQIRRKNIIVKKLIEYLDSSSEIILDGFVNFRLKEYVKHLEEIVDKAVDDFLMEREYKEFIRLLKYFVDIQEPKFSTVHVLVGYDGKYVLLDENRKEITNECIQEFINEISEGEINYDDLLVSSLITLAPENIVIHVAGQFRNKELLDTIKNVFAGKVLICSGCDICVRVEARSEK